MSDPELTISVGMTRRRFLAGTLLQVGGAIAAGISVPALLEACGTSASSTPTRAAGSVQSLTIRGSSETTNEVSPTDYILTFKKNIEAASHGKIKVNYFSVEELDSSFPANLVSTMGGQLTMCVQNYDFMYGNVPDLQVLGLPFLFKNGAQMYSVMDGPIGTDIVATAGQRMSLHISPVSNQGFQQIQTTSKPITSPSDLKGLKIRVKSAGVEADTITALGATPVVIGQTELYTSLLTGAVDGADIGDQTIPALKLGSVIHYVNYCNITPQIEVLIFNGPWYDSLDGTTRNLIDETVAAADAHDRTVLASLETTTNNQLEQQGMHIVTPSPAELQAFKNAVQPTYKNARQTYAAPGTKGGAWLDDILKVTS